MKDADVYRMALDRAAYALFQLKRFADMPQAAIDFVRAEHEKACEVLNEDVVSIQAQRPEAVAHSDHPLQHWDRTCQACIADPVPTKAHIVYCYQHVRDCLKELLRLYDWRNELGGIERDFNHDKKQMSRWLNQYGREKKQAWFVARELLDGGRKTPDFAPSPPGTK